MQSKTIHIVFQVLNFLSQACLSGQYDLSSDEKLLLLFLAKHKGVRGIYPSVITLSKELQRNETNIRRSLKRLKDKNLILIEYIPGKSSQYTLLLPEILSTTPGVHALPASMLPPAPTPGHPGRTRVDTPGVHAPQSERVNNPLNKTERARKKTALALSVDFDPTPESCDIAKRCGLTEDEANYEFDKFMNYHLEKGIEKTDWQLILQNWFIRAGEYKRQKGSINVKPEEVRSTVPWYNPADAQRGAAPIANLLNGLATQAREHMSKQGGKSNGLGNEGQGEKAKD